MKTVRLQFTTEFAKRNNNTKKISTVPFYQVCANTVKAKQSKAQQNMGAGYAFLPLKQVNLCKTF